MVFLLNKAKKHNIGLAIIIVSRLDRGQRLEVRGTSQGAYPLLGPALPPGPLNLYFLLTLHFCGFLPIFITSLFLFDSMPVACNPSIPTANIRFASRWLITLEYQNKK